MPSEKSKGIVCDRCLEELVFLKAIGRCKKCFEEIDEGIICKSCKNSTLTASCSCFENNGIAAILSQKLSGNMPYLDKLLASLMLLQLNYMGIPFPDIIVPLNDSFWKRFFSGYEADYLLSKKLARLTGAKFLIPNSLKTNHLVERKVIIVSCLCDKQAVQTLSNKLSNFLVKPIYYISFTS